jgi:hypothetical protein
VCAATALAAAAVCPKPPGCRRAPLNLSFIPSYALAPCPPRCAFFRAPRTLTSHPVAGAAAAEAADAFAAPAAAVEAEALVNVLALPAVVPAPAVVCARVWLCVCGCVCGCLREQESVCARVHACKASLKHFVVSKQFYNQRGPLGARNRRAPRLERSVALALAPLFGHHGSISTIPMPPARAGGANARAGASAGPRELTSRRSGPRRRGRRTGRAGRRRRGSRSVAAPSRRLPAAGTGGGCGGRAGQAVINHPLPRLAQGVVRSTHGLVSIRIAFRNHCAWQPARPPKRARAASQGIPRGRLTASTRVCPATPLARPAGPGGGFAPAGLPPARSSPAPPRLPGRSLGTRPQGGPPGCRLRARLRR